MALRNRLKSSSTLSGPLTKHKSVLFFYTIALFFCASHDFILCDSPPRFGLLHFICVVARTRKRERERKESEKKCSLGQRLRGATNKRKVPIDCARHPWPLQWSRNTEYYRVFLPRCTEFLRVPPNRFHSVRPIQQGRRRRHRVVASFTEFLWVPPDCLRVWRAFITANFYRVSAAENEDGANSVRTIQQWRRRRKDFFLFGRRGHDLRRIKLGKESSAQEKLGNTKSAKGKTCHNDTATHRLLSLSLSLLRQKKHS